MDGTIADRRALIGCAAAETAGVLAAAAALVVAIPGAAHAYLDPASGSLYLQLLLGGVAGIALALKLCWRRITGFFTSRPDRDEPED